MLLLKFPLAALASCLLSRVAQAVSPNIIMIMTDDQDRLLGSTDYQPVLRREFFDRGVEVINHFVTVAQCCPSRTALLRGQHAHNTNVTHVRAPGGNFDKFSLSGESRDYIAVWMQNAGYNTNYFGKFLNGYNTINFRNTPAGFDHAEFLVDPYTYSFGNAVLSRNGEQPTSYPHFHQTDVLRIKAIDRLDTLLQKKDEPFFMMIAPASPHGENSGTPTVPCQRHEALFPGAKAPRKANFNVEDSIQVQKSSWIHHLGILNDTELAYSDLVYRRRLQGLQGVDEIINDIFVKLEDEDALDNTYGKLMIYTADNGYHIGNFRMPPGKCTPYAEDTNAPFAVRGPGIPAGVKSLAPSSHVDLAATFLEIAGVPKGDTPGFLDGRSLLGQWQDPVRYETDEGMGLASGKEIINVEYWGNAQIEAPFGERSPSQNSYKTLRVVSSGYSFLFISWCTNEVELYDTLKDKFETQNLVNSTDPYYQRIKTRLNGLLLVTKSCEQDTCRDPWIALQPPEQPRRSSNIQNNRNYKDLSSLAFRNLDDALDPTYDDWFAGFPKIHFDSCLNYQLAANEKPFYPARAEFGLGLAHREPTDNFVSLEDSTQYVAGSNGTGTAGQRFATMGDLERIAVELTDEQLGTA